MTPTVTRAARLDLRTFQQELAQRLAKKTTAQVESSRLGLASRGAHWLLRLSDAGEVITMPQVVQVPLTHAWFLGVANVRGNLYGVVDFAGFLGGPPLTPAASTRLVLFGPRVGELNAGLLVERVLGLRNLSDLTPAAPLADAPAWYAERWTDAEGTPWQEVDLAKLARAPEFLQVGL